MTTGLTIGLATLGVFLAVLLPTGLFLYVEPRGRRLWAREGDTLATRRAPLAVRGGAWASFLVGELAVLWLAVPAVCAGLLYLQAKLGMWRPVGIGATALVGVAGLLQALMALRLMPFGVKLLMRDEGACKRAGVWARRMAVLNGVVLGGGLALDWAVRSVPRFVHPWLGVVLGWAALRPVLAFAAVCLVQAFLLAQSAHLAARQPIPVRVKK